MRAIYLYLFEDIYNLFFVRILVLNLGLYAIF